MTTTDTPTPPLTKSEIKAMIKNKPTPNYDKVAAKVRKVMYAIAQTYVPELCEAYIRERPKPEVKDVAERATKSFNRGWRVYDDWVTTAEEAIKQEYKEALAGWKQGIKAMVYEYCRGVLFHDKKVRQLSSSYTRTYKKKVADGKGGFDYRYTTTDRIYPKPPPEPSQQSRLVESLIDSYLAGI